MVGRAAGREQKLKSGHGAHSFTPHRNRDTVYDETDETELYSEGLN